MPYLIPGDELSIEQKQALRMNVDRTLQDRATTVKSIGRSNELVVRDIVPNLDINVAPLNTSQWITGALVAGVVPINYVNAPLANNKILAFYGIADLEANPVVDVVFFRVGATGGSTRGIAHLAQMFSKMTTDGYLDMAIVYDPQEVMFIQVVANAIAATERLILLGRVIEPVGATISGPAI